MNELITKVFIEQPEQHRLERFDQHKIVKKWIFQWIFKKGIGWDGFCEEKNSEKA